MPRFGSFGTILLIGYVLGIFGAPACRSIMAAIAPGKLPSNFFQGSVCGAGTMLLVVAILELVFGHEGEEEK